MTARAAAGRPIYAPEVLADLRSLRGVTQLSSAKKGHKLLLEAATRLQTLRLVRVQPITRDQASVELTAAGEAALKG